VADGVIVGSALIGRIAENLERPAGIEKAVERLARSIVAGLGNGTKPVDATS